MAVTRFDGRRELIMDEANAIQQLARRAEYLAPPVQERMSGLLRSYVDARIRSYDAGLNMARTEAAYREAFALQRQLWAQAVEVARDQLQLGDGLAVRRVGRCRAGAWAPAGGRRWTTTSR